MKTAPFTGSAVALVTPFTRSGVDFDKLSELIEFHIANKTDAIVVCGTTGEASTLPDDEHISILKHSVKVAAGRIPIIAGTGSNDTAHAISFSKIAEELGCDGLLVVTPYYNKTTQKGLKAHYEMIANSVSIPIIMYHIPGRTGVKMTLDTIKHLAKIPNIVAIKESSGDLSFAAQIVAETDLVLYSGNDDIIVPIMSIGGKGVISVVANILPEETHNICKDFESGNVLKAKEDFLRLLKLINTLFIEVNPIPIKTAMNLLGFDVGILRPPLCDMEDENLEILKTELIKAGLKIK